MQTTENPDDKKLIDRQTLKATKIVAISLLGLWCGFLAVFFILKCSFPDDYQNFVGIFGDFFGSFNALVSALAIVGAALAIILQSKELKETREEVKAQTMALTNQHTEAERTRSEMQFQRNVNAIYSQIEILQKTTDQEYNRFHALLKNLDSFGAGQRPLFKDGIKTSLEKNIQLAQNLLGLLEIANYTINQKENIENRDYLTIEKINLVKLIVRNNIHPLIKDKLSKNTDFELARNATDSPHLIIIQQLQEKYKVIAAPQ